MPTFTNIRGTSEPHFRISLSGPTIYHGEADPAITPPPVVDRIGGVLNPGDLYIRTDGATQGLYVFGGASDTDWNEFLETGGTSPTIISGNLIVQGEFETYDNILLLNSEIGAALAGGIGGLEIGRIAGSGENVQWLWVEADSAWRPVSDNPINTTLHNISVGNNLVVGDENALGRLTVPDGTTATPGIRFSSSNVGIYSDGTILGFSTAGDSQWTIDGTGNLLPRVSSQHIGTSVIPVGNIYGTVFIGEDGLETAPTFTFDSDTTSGMFTDAAGEIVFSAGGTEEVRITGSEVELQGTLKITDGVNNWTIDNDGADSNKLKLAYNTTDAVVITTSGEILVDDGDTNGGLGPFVPSYSFVSDPTTGILLDTNDIVFTLGGVSAHLIISPTAINAPAATVNFAQDLTTKAYVDSVAGGSWLEPVIVKDDTAYPNLAAAEAAMNTGPGFSVDGIPMTNGDRILYTGFPTPPAVPFNTIYIVNGTPGSGAALDSADPGLEASDGDTVYVIDGTSTNNVYSYNKDDTWTEISATSGFGGTLYFNYERQTALVAQTVFTLADIKYAPTADGARLLVYINGVKQVFDPDAGGPIIGSYTETNETTVTFTVAPGVGKIVEFYGVGLATTDGVLKREDQTGWTVPTPLITLQTITYVTTQDGLLVFLNGQKVVNDGLSYTEASSSTIQWIAPALVATDVLEFYSSVPIVAGVNLEDISNVSAAIAPLNNDQLTYNTTSGLWEPGAQGTSQVGLLYDESDGLGLNGTINGVNDGFTTTDVIVNSKNLIGPSKRSYIQLFVNGVLQREGSGPNDDYVVGNPATITFNAGSIPQTGDTITVFQL